MPDIVTDGPVLFFGGCYSNLEATVALRGEAARLGIRPDNIVCTGDVVAYCADPVATVEAICDWGVHVIMGNCEESLGWSKTIAAAASRRGRSANGCPSTGTHMPTARSAKSNGHGCDRCRGASTS